MKKLFLIFTCSQILRIKRCRRAFYFMLYAYLLLSIAPISVFAQTTLSPTDGPTPTSSDRLQEIKEKVEERIQEIKESVQKRAFWGTLKQITNSTLVLDTPLGERRVKTNDETKITLDKKSAKVTDLAIGNFLIVIGTKDKNETLTATKILAFSKPPKEAVKRQAIFGKVSDISAEEKIIVVTHIKKPGVTYQVKITNKTVITKKVEGKIKKVDFAAIAIGDRIVAVATKDANTFTAKIIHVIPGKAEGLEKQATITPTSAKTSPTPTPKAKSSPTP